MDGNICILCAVALTGTGEFGAGNKASLTGYVQSRHNSNLANASRHSQHRTRGGI